MDPIQFIVNERGERTAVIIRIDEYRQILDKLRKSDNFLASDEATTSGETSVPWGEAIARIKRNRK
jgi:hypothetical protein